MALLLTASSRLMVDVTNFMYVVVISFDILKIADLVSECGTRASVCIYVWLYSLFVEPWPLFQLLNLYTFGKGPWTGDQPDARQL
jgi:hypothetical protein